MVATGQEVVRENKISLRSGKSQEISLRLSQSLKEVRKKGNFNRTCLHFEDMNRVILVEYFSFKELSIHVHCI